jgi:hypothetical protein
MERSSAQDLSTKLATKLATKFLRLENLTGAWTFVLFVSFVVKQLVLASLFLVCKELLSHVSRRQEPVDDYGDDYGGRARNSPRYP